MATYKNSYSWRKCHIPTSLCAQITPRTFLAFRWNQLPDRYPIGQESVCETTGQRKVGHVQLGVRDSRTGSCRIRDSVVEPELGGVSRSEDFVMDRSKGEPQLTTCTDK